MLNSSKILKVSVIWATILYVVCAIIAWLLPSIYTWSASKIVHFGMAVEEPSLTFGNIILGLILWDILALLIVWLYVFLYNKLN